MRNKLTTMAMLLAVLSGCSIDPSGRAGKKGAATNGAGDELDDKSVDDAGKAAGDDLAATLYVIKELAKAGADAKRLSMGSDSRWYLNRQNSLVHMSPGGLASQFDLSAKTWGVTNQESGAAGALFVANMVAEGWVGAFAEELTYLDLKSSALESFALPVTLSKAGDIVGVAPGMVGLHGPEAIYLFAYDGGDASLKKFAKPGAPVKSLGLCDKGCAFWVWDGTDFFVAPTLADGLQKVTVTMQVRVKMIAYAGVMSVTGAKGTFTTLFAVDEQFSLYRGGEEANAALEPTWANVQAIAQESCIPCHVDDGFDKEAVWTGLKAEIIRRVAVETKTEVFAMPTWETKYGKELADVKRKLIIGWLNGEKATDGGTFGENTAGPDVPLTGELKMLSDAHCKSCHATAVTTNYWLARKADAAARLTSGDMPRGTPSMSDADRTRLTQLINDL